MLLLGPVMLQFHSLPQCVHPILALLPSAFPFVPYPEERAQR